MDASFAEYAGMEAKIVVPDAVDFQLLQERSTSKPVVTVVYHVIEGNISSLQNASSANNASLGYERNEELARIEIAVLATIFALAVVGNVCVLVALGRRRRITSRMHMFILHLSVADLLVALCNILPQLAWDLTGTFRGGDFLCRTVTFLQVFVMYLSTYVLVMTAIDRYRAICYPLSNHNWTPRTVNILIVGVYLISAILSIPQPLLFRYQETGNGVEDCRANFDPPWLLHLYILSFTALVYILPFLLLLFTYGSICYTLWVHQPLTTHRTHRTPSPTNTTTTTTTNTTPSPRHPAVMTSSSVVMTTTKDGECCVTVTPTSTPTPTLERLGMVAAAASQATSNGSPGGGGRNGLVRPRAHSVRGFSRAKLKTVKLTFVVILAYLLCWSPFFISHICWLYDPQQENNSAVVIMVLLSSLNSCCNPWIYLAFSGNLLKNLLPCRFPFCPSTPSSPHPNPLYTPSPSRQRGGMEMVGFSPRHPHHHHRPGDGRSPSPGATSSPPLKAGQGVKFCRGHNMMGGGEGGSSPRHGANSTLRHSSLTSLLTTRHTSAVRHPSGTCPGLGAGGVTGSGHLPDGECRKNGHAGDKPRHGDCAANGSAARQRRGKLPSAFFLRSTSSAEDSTSQGSKESSGSSSNPRSPHLYKRARLHERPPEEVAEAQLKWENHTGKRGHATSCFTYEGDTE